MSRSPLLLVLICAFVVNGSHIAESIGRISQEFETNVKKEMNSAAEKAQQTAQGVLIGLSAAVDKSQAWLDHEVDKHLAVMDKACKPDDMVAKNVTHDSLWKCLEMVRVVTDGTNIASKGFEVASDILQTLDNFMESLTACVLGPTQSVSEMVACYFSVVGSIATGVAQNIEQVEHYINVVKRDVSDIHAAVELCSNQTLYRSLIYITKQQNDCKISNKSMNA